MLAGTVRPQALRKTAGRSALQLPLEPDLRLFDHWRWQWNDLARRAGVDHLPVRVVSDHQMTLAPTVARQGAVEITIERDPRPFRGPAGVLRDLGEDYHPDDWLLVANASQWLRRPLGRLVHALADQAGDAAVLAQPDASPAGLMLVRCRCLQAISEVGYIDLHEQALPAIARDWRVRVVHWSSQTSQSLRTWHNYLNVLRQYHGPKQQGQHPATRADGQPVFNLIEPGATVPPDALVHDSVVLAGGKVGPGAAVIRCLVGPNGAVAPGRCRIDALIG